MGQRAGFPRLAPQPSLQGLSQRAQIAEKCGTALTGHSGDEERQRYLDAGMDDFVTKPIKTELLIAIIAQAISNS
ncbi:MAG: hypothetical protein VX893_15700 [Candidatus Latescibacterota bacterium]|nr:hypothetical protein [Candidatus Latescibacterota bacterium]